jgi:maltose O-acetyltransferase
MENPKFEIECLEHINIVVPDIEVATKLYRDLFSAEVLYTFPRFKNIGFAKNAGFLTHPEEVEVTLRHLYIPSVKLYLELSEYHHPKGEQAITYRNANDVGGPRHIGFIVREIETAFNYIKKIVGVRLINEDPNYRPCQLSPITEKDFYFSSQEKERNPEMKERLCHVGSKIRFFYFIDMFGIQWEFKEAA